MLIKEFIYAVYEGLNVQSDDNRISPRLIYFTGKNIRSQLFRQEANKDELWNGANAQILTDFELIKNSVSETEYYTSDIVVHKSVRNLPTLVDTKFGKIILGVYFNNGARLTPTDYPTWVASKKRRFQLPTAGARYFIRNDKLCVVDYDPLAECIVVFVEGVFDNPEELATECDYVGDMEMAMPSYLADRVIRMTVEFIRGKYALPADTKNDASETMIINSQQE